MYCARSNVAFLRIGVTTAFSNSTGQTSHSKEVFMTSIINERTKSKQFFNSQLRMGSSEHVFEGEAAMTFLYPAADAGTND